jgi:hypothetical protein
MKLFQHNLTVPREVQEENFMKRGDYPGCSMKFKLFPHSIQFIYLFNKRAIHYTKCTKVFSKSKHDFQEFCPLSIDFEIQFHHIIFPTWFQLPLPRYDFRFPGGPAGGHTPQRCGGRSGPRGAQMYHGLESSGQCDLASGRQAGDLVARGESPVSSGVQTGQWHVHVSGAE